MATTTDVIPATDGDFDTLQGILVTAVTNNAVAWKIPPSEILKVTAKQAVWTPAWAKAKDKLNSTPAEKEAKTLARTEYEKVLRPFIQVWIYRNPDMDAAAVQNCGLKPRDTVHTAAQKPAQPVGHAKRGAPLEIDAECDALDNAEYYGCLMMESGPLPDNVTITAEGKLVVGADKPSAAGPSPTGLQADFTKQRKKKFTALKHDVNYWFYFYAVNAAGVSPLSEGVTIQCW